MPEINQFIKDNSRWLLVLLFSAGALYSEMQSFRTVEERLEKKIKIIKDNTEEIHRLELKIVVLETQKCK